MMPYRMVKTCESGGTSVRLESVPALDGQTDRRTDRRGKTIWRCACIASWRAITRATKSSFHIVSFLKYEKANS